MKFQGMNQAGPRGLGGDGPSTSGFSSNHGRGGNIAGLVVVLAIILLLASGGVLVASVKGKATPKQPVPEVQPAEPQTIVQPALIETEEVLVPTKHIEAGQPLDPAMFARMSLPRSAVPPGAVRLFEELDNGFNTLSATTIQDLALSDISTCC